MDSAQRKALKAKAHKLDPLVQIGAKGLTDEVVAEVDRALRAHQLIKVRAATLERPARSEAFQSLCERTRAELVQEVGKVLVLYRKSDE